MPAILWIILVLLAIYLIVILISFAFKVLIASLVAIIAGIAAGYTVLLVADWVQVRKLRNPATLASVASLELTPAGLSFQLADEKVQRWTSSNSWNWEAALFSCGMAAWALYLSLNGTSSVFGNSAPVGRFFAWLTPLVLMVMFAKGAGMNRSRTSRMKARADSIAAGLRACLKSVHELDGNEGSIRAIASSLGIDWPEEYRRALERYVENNGTALVLDPSSADDFLKSLIVLARMDLDRLTNASRQWDAVWTRYEKLADVLCYVDRPTIAFKLDELGRGLPALKVLLARREWDTFSTQLRIAESVMAILEKNAEDREFDPAQAPPPPSASMTLDEAYEILGVDAKTPDDEVKKAWKRLSKRDHEGLQSPYDTVKKASEAHLKKVNQASPKILCSRGSHEWIGYEQDEQATCKYCEQWITHKGHIHEICQHCPAVNQ